MGKIGFKDGPKTNYFFYIMSSCTIIIAFFNNFFSLISSQPRGKQNCACDFLLFKYFWLFLSISDCFHAEYSFKARWFIAIKNEDKSLLGKTWTQFCTAVCWKCVCKVESWSFKAVFVLEFVKCSPNRNIFPAKSSNHGNCNIKFRLNSFSNQITICQISFEIFGVKQIDARAKK